MYFMYNKLKFLHRKTQSVFFFKFIMIRLLSHHHPAANPSPPFPLCPAAGQRGRGGEGLAEAQLPHIFQDGVSPFAPVAFRPPAAVRGLGRGGVGHEPARAMHHLSRQCIHNKTERKTTMGKLCDKDGGENNIKNEVA